MSTFNIGSQNAASIQNIAGDSLVEGGIQATAEWQVVELRLAIDQALKDTGAYGLPAVNAALSAASAEAARPNADKGRIAGLLESAVRGLRDAGALVDAGTSAGSALRRAATALGPLGATILTLL